MFFYGHIVLGLVIVCKSVKVWGQATVLSFVMPAIMEANQHCDMGASSSASQPAFPVGAGTEHWGGIRHILECHVVWRSRAGSRWARR